MKVFLSMLCLLYAVEGYTFANKTKLHNDLFTNYVKKFRPGENQTIPTELNFSFHIRSIKELQESNAVMGVVGSLGVEWKDVRLAWNPLDYGDDLNQTFVFVEDIWAPYMVLMNPFEEIRPILSGGFSCEVWYNGYVSCLPPPNIYEALCIADVRFYPFDSKICTLQAYVSGYHSSDLKFKNQSKTFNMEMYVDNEPWFIEHTLISVHTDNLSNKIVEILKFELMVQRISDRHMWDLFPIIVLSGIQIVVFWLPNETGERIEFSVTVLLAEVVYLSVIQEKIPEASKTTSYLLYKQLADLIMNFVIVIFVAVTRFIYYFETEEPEETEDTLSKMESSRTRKQTEQPKETEDTLSKMESLRTRKQTEQLEETEGTPRKMKCSSMMTQTEQPKESEETPSEIESLRKPTKGKKSGNYNGKKFNFSFFGLCASLIVLNNTLFFWKMNVL